MGDECAGVFVQWCGNVKMFPVLDETQQLEDRGELSHLAARAIEKISESVTYLFPDAWMQDAGAIQHGGVVAGWRQAPRLPVQGDRHGVP